ncbi:hypothetical protein [Myxococcus phage Mx1]|nr:hypothetical protein [Myxococcus phage Mx1]
MTKAKTSIYHVTTYKHNGKTKTYRTKALTPVHEHLRKKFEGTTMRCDPSKPWPFGVYAEVVE